MRPRFLARGTLALSVILAAACGVSNVPIPPEESGNLAAAHIEEFERNDNPLDEPGSPNQLRAVQYVTDYFKSLGLAATTQAVPLVRMIPRKTMVQLHGPNEEVITPDTDGGDMVIWPGLHQNQVSLDTEVVFAGYGIIAPEYKRNDYRNVDVSGKIVVVLQGSPHTYSHDDLGILGETYYGTRHYKYAEGARHGAAAVLIIHAEVDTEWTDIVTSASGSVLDIHSTQSSAAHYVRTEVEGWISRSAAEKLFNIGGFNYDVLFEEAHSLAFQPIPIPGVRVTVDMTSDIDEFISYDAFAILPGQTSEYLMLAARWNRIDQEEWGGHAITLSTSRDPAPSAATTLGSGQRTMNDDGSGAAVVMEVARGLVEAGTTPMRGIVFMVGTALKPGMIGLEYYIEQPPSMMPSNKPNALVFMDRGDLEGTSQRVGKIGIDSDEALAQLAREASIEQGRLVELDQSHSRRFYYKFVQTELAKEGVRVIYLTTRPEEDHLQHLRRVAENDATGAEDSVVPHPSRDRALLTDLILRVANATNWPRRTPTPLEIP